MECCAKYPESLTGLQIYGINNSESYNTLYYIDTSVLLGNIPLAKFINATSGTRVVYFP